MFAQVKNVVGWMRSRCAPIKAAAVETLEQRQLLSTSIGQLGLDDHRIYGVGDYTFTLKSAATFNADFPSGQMFLYRGQELMASGTKISKPLMASGTYTLQTAGGMGTALSLWTNQMSPPTRLQAEVWGGGAVHLNWDDNSDSEIQYRVDRWTRLGWRRSVRVGANNSAAMIDHLVPGATTTYRVSAVDANGNSERSANIVSATTLDMNTNGWYRIKVPTVSDGEHGYTLESGSLRIWPAYQKGTNQRESKWVYASSWQSAVWQYVTTYADQGGSLVDVPLNFNTHELYDGDEIHLTHSFPSSGGFRVNTAGQIAADVATYQNNNGGFKIDLDPDTKIISLEDSYERIDRDYDDFYWVLDVEKVEVSFKESYSDQFAGFDDNNITNPGSKKGFVLMGTRSDNNIYTKFDMQIDGDADVTDDLVYAYENADGSDPSNVVNSSTSGGKVHVDGAVPSPSVTNEDAYNIYALAGFDLNSDGKLTPDETVAKSALFKVVSQAKYDAAKASLATEVALGQAAGFVYASDWLNAFITGADFSNSTSSSTTISGTDTRLDHHVGADFTASPNARKHSFSSGDAITIKLANDAASLTNQQIIDYATSPAVENQVLAAAHELTPTFDGNGHYVADTDWIGPFNLTLTGAFYPGDSEIPSDFSVALGHIGFSNVKVSFRGFHEAQREEADESHGPGVTHTYGISEIKIEGKMTDIYDFAYGSPGGKATRAAVVQAGFGTLGNAGNVRSVEANMDNRVTWQKVYDEHFEEDVPE